ncbi:MAG: 3'-5' exonuclease [Saprospiraceae bacterium]
MYRTNGQSRVFEEQLRRIFLIESTSLSFYNRKEIKDVVSYMRLTVNDKDDEALKRIINYPRRGIGNSTIEEIARIAEDNDISMWKSFQR